MIIGLGLDFVEIRRVERELAQGKWSSGDGVFTAGELERSYSYKNPTKWMAACFAAKEAAVKALGIEVRDLAMFGEAEVVFRGEYAGLKLHGRLKAESEKHGVKHIRVALAPNPNHAAAVVVLEA